MLKQLFRDSVTYTLPRLLTAAVGIFLLPLYTSRLTSSELGLFDMGSIVMSIASLVVALEVSQGAARYYCDDADPVRRREYFSTALAFTFAAFAVFCAVAVIAAPYAASAILGPGATAVTVVLVAAAATAVSAFQLGVAQLRWLLRPAAFVFCCILQLVVNASVAVSLVMKGGYGVHGLLWGVIAGAAAAFAASLWMARDGLGFSLSRARLHEMLAFSGPLVTSSAAVWIALYVDRLAIKELMTLADLGRYGVAYRFANAVDIVMVGFDKAFMPLLYANYRDPVTRLALAKALRMLVALGGAILLALAAAAHDLVHLLATPEYQSAVPLVPVLAGGVLLSRLTSIAPGLWIANRTAAVAGINVSIAVVNLILNVVLIPRLGLIGAGLATATSALFGFTVNMIASQRQYPVSHDWSRLLAGSIVLGVGIAVLLGFGARFAPLSPLGIVAKAFTATTMLALAAAILLTRDEWRGIGLSLRRRALLVTG